MTVFHSIMEKQSVSVLYRVHSSLGITGPPPSTQQTYLPCWLWADLAAPGAQHFGTGGCSVFKTKSPMTASSRVTIPPAAQLAPLQKMPRLDALFCLPDTTLPLPRRVNRKEALILPCFLPGQPQKCGGDI